MTKLNGYAATLILVILGIFSSVAMAQSALLQQLEDSFVGLHEKVGPSVVSIEVKGKAAELPQGMEEFYRFFGMPKPEPGQRRQLPRPQGMGSGFIYSEDGVIITNNHVVEDAEEIVVRLWNGSEYPATLLGTDPEGDLAAIKVDAQEKLPAAELGDSDGLRVGQFSIAIGSPRGFDGSVSFGHISALGREGLYGLQMQGLVFQHLIQTDAAINLGNSGGPLVDIHGRVIGINVAIIYGANSIGFAIPINTAKQVIPQLIAKGKVTRGYLGVSIKDAKEFAEAVELPDQRGAIVDQVQPGTPAKRAGIQTYDVLRKIDGKVVEDATDLVRTISSYLPGEAVKVEIWRDGKMQEVVVQLEERNLVAGATSEDTKVFGLELRDLTPTLIERLKLREGVKGVLVHSVEPDSPAEKAHLMPGDVIIELARESVSSVADFQRIVESHAQSGSSFLLRYVRGEREPEITVIHISEE